MIKELNKVTKLYEEAKKIGNYNDIVRLEKEIK